MTSAITLSICGVGYVALSPGEVKSRVQVVADQASCHTVNTAITGYLMNNGEAPTSIAQLTSYVQGDISQYRIVEGLATGPGCA